MEIKETIDMTLPLWGILGVVAFAAYHMVRIHFEQKTMKSDLRIIKSILLKQPIENDEDDSKEL